MRLDIAGRDTDEPLDQWKFKWNGCKIDVFYITKSFYRTER